mmetsp:Transcript_18338/g.38549  ORF Transcript_18338/g.38549 Transcript_18338/m.38549 type:complete len:90 (-) Transcript_18338:1232-1501(-)
MILYTPLYHCGYFVKCLGPPYCLGRFVLTQQKGTATGLIGSFIHQKIKVFLIDIDYVFFHFEWFDATLDGEFKRAGIDNSHDVCQDRIR